MKLSKHLGDDIDASSENCDSTDSSNETNDGGETPGLSLILGIAPLNMDRNKDTAVPHFYTSVTVRCVEVQ
jgi:hypothetical protein